MADRPTLFILDAYSLIFQVFHAIPQMAGPAGQPTNAVFGSFRDLLNLIRSRSPDYLAAAFDGPGPVFRAEIFAEYKANRSAMPEDLQSQIPVLHRLFQAFNIPILMQSGYEADDLIATLTHLAHERDLDVYICTADKDARQLLSEKVRILNLRKSQILDVPGLLEEWSIRPDQVVDLLSLTGDSVDNVPGVPGIGIKTAAKLLQEYGDLDTLLSRVQSVSGKKLQENLKAHGETALLARRLVELKTDLPLDLDWERLKYAGYDAKALKDLCIECGFHRFLNEIGQSTQQQEATWDYSLYRTVDTPEALQDFLVRLSAQTRISVDTETTHLDPLRAEVVGLSFCWEPGQGWYLPLRGPFGSQTLDPAKTLELLKPVLENPDTEKIGQNLKYDMLVLQRAGVQIRGPITDTMVLSYLLESGERNHNLDELSRRLLDHTMIPITELIGSGKKQMTMDRVPVEKVAVYAAEDADAAWRLGALLAPRVRSEGLWKLYAELERPLIWVLAGMEASGISLDVARLRQLSSEFADRLQIIQDQIFQCAGRPFNISSGPQLRVVLFEELKLPVLKKTPKGEPSTDAEVLEELAPKHPLPRLIVQYRQLEKLKNTYLDTLPDLVHHDGRVHASFNQVVAATGRLSSSDPNLQNIPVRSEDGRQIRQAFIPGFPAWSLLSADYSQVELRVLAHFSEDPRLLKAFADDQDIHAVVASEIFQVPLENVNSEQRRMAKTVNFGVIYGLSGFGLAARLGISRAEGDAFIESYFQEYRGVAEFITRTLTQAKERGFVETILGRRRAVAGVKSTDRMRSQPERIAVNAVIQGSAADLIKKAMIDLHQQLPDRGFKARMLLQIHDELVFEAPDEEIPALARLVNHSMSHALTLAVPIKVDIAAGPNWLDVQTIEV